MTAVRTMLHVEVDDNAHEKIEDTGSMRLTTTDTGEVFFAVAGGTQLSKGKWRHRVIRLATEDLVGMA